MTLRSEKLAVDDYKWKELYAFDRVGFMKEWKRLCKAIKKGVSNKFKIRGYKYE